MNKFREVRERAPLAEYVKNRLHHVNNRPVCPFCGSGNGHTQDSDSAFFINPRQPWRWSCFSCGRHGDIFDLVDQVENLGGNKARQLSWVESWAGIPKVDCAKQCNPKAPPTSQRTIGSHQGGQASAKRYVEDTRSNVLDPECIDYLRARGFSESDALAFGLGYDKRRKMLVIPYPGSDFYHIGRFIRPGKLKHFKPRSDQVGSEPLFNPAALDESCFFIVEGAVDALSVIATGYPAMSVGGAANWRRLANSIDRRQKKPHPIILFDKDPTGDKASADLLSWLTSHEITSTLARIPEEICAKDPNEWFSQDRTSFGKFLESQAKKGDNRA